MCIEDHEVVSETLVPIFSSDGDGAACQRMCDHECFS